MDERDILYLLTFQTNVNYAFASDLQCNLCHNWNPILTIGATFYEMQLHVGLGRP